MILKCNTLNEQAPSIAVQYRKDGKVVCVDDETGAGVELPDDLRVADLVDISFYGSRAMTQQLVCIPAWPVEEAA